MIRFLKTVCVVAALAASGCARTSPARFYALQSTVVPATAHEEKNFVLAVGPMSVATHLDRPQMATRVGPNELRFDNYHRWAEPLKDSIPTVLCDDLRAALPGVRLVQYPGSETLAFDWRVMVQVIRLDATPSGEATLRAGWTIVAQGKETQEAGAMFEKSVPVEKNDYASVAAAESKLLALLAEDIAAAVRTLGPVQSNE